MSTAISTRTRDRTHAAARTGSAYPVPVAELASRVQEQAHGLQAWPSLRQVMTTHRIGRPKATAVLKVLRESGFDPTDPTGPDPETAKLAADPEFHRHAGHDGRGRTDCSYCPSPGDLDNLDEPDDPPDDEPDDEPTPTEVSGLLSGAVDAHPDTAGADRPGYVVDQREPAEMPDWLVQRLRPAPPPPPASTAPVSTADAGARVGRWRVWPLLVISLGAFVSIWGGWVGLGELTGFGPIRLLPGIADQVVINTAITLPIGVEAYAAFALRAWLAPDRGVSVRARRFACWSAIGALGLGAAGQIAYHLMTAAQITRAPWPITAFVSCLPVLVLGCGAALAHLTRDQHHHDQHDHDQHADGEHDEHGEGR